MTESREGHRRLAVSTLICGVAVAMLAGCTMTAPQPAGSSGTPGRAVSAAATPVPTSAATPSASPPRPGEAGSGAAGSGGPESTECDDNALTLSLNSRPMDSGAGSFYWDLQLTNTSDARCTLEGYPALFLLSADSGKPIGVASGQESRSRAVEVPLQPDESAYSLLHLTQAGAYGCPLVPVTELAVTLPNGEKSHRVATPNPIEGCDDEVTELIRVSALEPSPVVY